MRQVNTGEKGSETPPGERNLEGLSAAALQ